MLAKCHCVTVKLLLKEIHNNSPNNLIRRTRYWPVIIELAKWKQENTPHLKSFTLDGHPKALIETISESLLADFKTAPLIIQTANITRVMKPALGADIPQLSLSELASRCPLWIISCSGAVKLGCPLYPRKLLRQSDGYDKPRK